MSQEGSTIRVPGSVLTVSWAWLELFALAAGETSPAPCADTNQSRSPTVCSNYPGSKENGIFIIIQAIFIFNASRLDHRRHDAAAQETAVPADPAQMHTHTHTQNNTSTHTHTHKVWRAQNLTLPSRKPAMKPPHKTQNQEILSSGLHRSVRNSRTPNPASERLEPKIPSLFKKAAKGPRQPCRSWEVRSSKRPRAACHRPPGSEVQRKPVS